MAAISANLAKISFAALTSSNPTTRTAEIDRLRNACKGVGFFYLVDHGIPRMLVHRLFNSAYNFFQLPENVKECWNQDAQIFEPKTMRGYCPVGAEEVNPGNDVDNKQFFEFGVERPYVKGELFSGPTIAPSDEEVPDFTKSYLELLDHAIKLLVPGLARALALALGVKEDFFTKHITEERMIATARANYYPPHTGGTGRHTDNGLFTILLQQTQVGHSSLRVLSGGEWKHVEASDDTLVVNLANIMQFWSGGEFVSTPHWVKHHGDYYRVSCPIFCYPDPDTEMIPLGGTREQMRVVRDVIMRDLEDLFETGNGAADWLDGCKKGTGNCNCWRCS